jgi:hypothetical protein
VPGETVQERYPDERRAATVGRGGTSVTRGAVREERPA